MKRPWLIIAVVLGMVLCVCAVGYRVYREFTQVEMGEHASSIEWLPETASNICYYKSYSRTAYEFDMPEQAFMLLAESKGWRMQRMGGEAMTIRRYYWCLHPSHPNSLPPTSTEKEMSELRARLAAWETAAFQQISNGYALNIRSSGGGGINVGYDPFLKRAFVFTTPR